MNWYQNCYRRNLIDMHIEEWNKCFLEKLDVDFYIEMLKKSQVQAAMIYANSHVGYCYWDTPYGQHHAQPKTNRFLENMLKKCNESNIHTVVYFTLVYDNYCYDNHTDWRMIDQHGRYGRALPHTEYPEGRYGRCCVNSEPYKQYIKNQLGDLIQKFTFDGFFLDMTFWPIICHCDNCRGKYKAETGMNIPVVIDWNDRDWLCFQGKREEWLSNFAAEITDFVKARKPELSVEHQNSGILYDWQRGVTEGNIFASDYAGGDLYGGLKEQSFACKLYRSLSMNQPFEYMTSRADPNLTYHTCMKSEQSLTQHVYTTFAHHGAFLFIDAIDPDGKIRAKPYELMGKIFNKSKAYEPYFTGKPCAEVAIYISLTSKIDLAINGSLLTEIDAPMPFSELSAALAAADTLKSHNVLYDVISRKNLDSLKDIKTLILPDIYILDDYEVDKIKGFVENGGSLYISGGTNNPCMQEFLGITCHGITKERLTYMKPTPNAHTLLKALKDDVPLTIIGKQCLVEVTSDCEVLATITLPYTDPDDDSIFASIHSNPPGIDTASPAIVYRKAGNGQILWAAAPLEISPAFDNKEFFYSIIHTLNGGFNFYSNAPAPVEFTLFCDEDRYIVHLVNEQDYEPLVIVHNIEFSMDISGVTITNVRLAPEGTPLRYEILCSRLTVWLPELYIHEMILIDFYKEEELF